MTLVIRRPWCVLAFLILAGPATGANSQAPGEVAVATQSAVAGSSVIEACTPDQEERWNFVANEQLGAAAADAVEAHRWIGPVANRKKAANLGTGDFGGRNWFPADIYKKTVCGGFSRFTVFDPIQSGAETDFHVHFEPSDAFRFSIDELGDVSRKPEIYGEITLPKLFRKREAGGKAWYAPAPGHPFKSVTARTDKIQEGEDICTYGPWVTEEFHQFQPEIHPSELFWFRDTDASHVVQVFAAHDASDRYQKEKYFCSITGRPDACEELPAEFRAWATPSSRYQILVPYELALDREESRTMKITVPARSFAGDIGQGRLEPVRILHEAGQSVLNVSRYSVPGFLSVSETDGQRCRSQSTGSPRLLGYVGISLVLEGKTGGQAFAQISIDGELTGTNYSRRPFVAASVRPPEPSVDFNALRASGGTLTPANREALVLATQFKEPDVNISGRRYEIDVEALYAPGNEEAASFVNAVRRGQAFEDDNSNFHQENTVKRYRALFGTTPFHANVTATFDGAVLPVQTCKGGRPTGRDVAVCLEDEKSGGRISVDDEVVDVVVRYGPDASGILKLAGVVTDPFGLKGSVPERTVRIPLSRVLDKDGLLGDVHSVLDEANLDQGQLDILAQGLRDTGLKRTPGAFAEQLPYLPKRDEPARRARTFWLMAKTYSRDLSLDGLERRSLCRMLASLKGTPPSCG
jgi:hypothetical protein